MKKAIILIFSQIVLIASLFASPVLAAGVAMGPATLEIEDALRGGEYFRTLSVFNPSTPQNDYTIRADGEAAGWLSFFNWETNEPIEQITIEGQSKATILVQMDIPLDIANGVYTATIYAETAPEELEEGMGASAMLRATTELTIAVSGTQTIDGTVGSITGLDTEVGMPWRLEVVFRNTGNIEVNPEINCQISRNGDPVGEINHADTKVKPGDTETIKVEWDTTGQEIGDYQAEVDVSLGDMEIDKGNVGFSLLPVGTLTREGTLSEISIGGGRTVVGNLMTVLAEFVNTGQIDTTARFIGEVHLDGELIGTLESDELMVPVGDSTILKSYLGLKKPGKYEISGYVNYEGKKTEVQGFSFTATEEIVATTDIGGDSETTTTSQPISPWIPIVGGVLGVLVLAIIIILKAPWVKLRPARKMLLAQWASLKLACRNSSAQFARLQPAYKVLMSPWARLRNNLALKRVRLQAACKVLIRAQLRKMHLVQQKPAAEQVRSSRQKTGKPRRNSHRR